MQQKHISPLNTLISALARSLAPTTTQANTLRSTTVAAAIVAALSACNALPLVGARPATAPAGAAVSGSSAAVPAPADGPAATSVAPASTMTRAPGTQPTPASDAESKPALTSAAVVPGAPRPPEAPVLKPFAEVIRGAQETKGFFGLWQKDDGRVWLEIAPDQLEKPFFFAVSMASGLGEHYFLPGLMGQEHVVVLRRFGNQIQLVASNLRVRATSGTPLARAVRESYSDSLLAAAPVASAPHPERKTFLIDAAMLLGGDIAGAQTMLDGAYRMGYALDRANGSIERARTMQSGTFITYRSHFAVGRMPAAPLLGQGPTPPATVPDPRSLFLTFAYNLVPLPEQPMRARVADQRVGHFTTAFRDLADTASDDRRTHYIERWRLEKKDPQAEVSEPKEPILVWLDRNIPEKYRAAVQAGVLEWNKAFERAGFKSAIVAQQQPDDADWTTLEGTRHLAVRWFAMDGPGAMAVGPSQADPRTGELMRGAAIIPENWARVSRTAISETLPRPAAAASVAELLNGRQCNYSMEALEQLAFGLEVLAARGLIDPTGAEAERFVADSLKDVVMHEVGHALGLRHNFKASAGVKLDQLRDAAWVREHGVSNSVMDYVALNIPLENEAPTVYTQSTLGAYDYWAIEYAYREFAPEQEKEGLAKIAARSAAHPELAYATDEDAGRQGGGIDPLVNAFDLGDDPLAYYQRRFILARELWTRTQQRELKADESYAFYRRNLARGLGQISYTAPQIAKYVGGVYTSRELAGGGHAVLTPVPAAKQREALGLLAREVFSTDSFRFDPRFMSRLGVDHLERFQPGHAHSASLDFSLATSVLGIQRTVLDQLMSEGVAARLADAETKVADPRDLLTFAEVQTQLTDAIWSELKSGKPIDSLRRNLQREHLKRLAGALLRPSPNVAADVRAVQRQVAMRLEADLKRALSSKRGEMERAHLAESQSALSEALRAPMWRQGV
jgi:hypothetical protein